MKVRKDVHSEAILNENQWGSHKYEFGLPWDGTGGRAKAPPPLQGGKTFLWPCSL